jgi:transposase
MPQLHRPTFSPESRLIAEGVTVQVQNNQVVYFSGLLPTFQHAEDDLQSFRMYTSSLIEMKQARQVDIARTFCIPLSTVKRYLKLLRSRGKKAFFADHARRSAAVLKGETRQIVQRLIAEGKTVPEVAEASGVKANTLHKAIRTGRLPRVSNSPSVKKKYPLPSPHPSPHKANGVRPTAQP